MDINKQVVDLETPLYIAIDGQHVKIAEFLINQNANVSIPRKSGFTPLYIAAYRGFDGLTKMLIDKGADILAKDATYCL